MKAATCEEPGETSYTSAKFENAAFEIQTKTLADFQALGHDWEEPFYTWAEDNSSVTATRICKNNAEHREEETVIVISAITKAATCEEPGETTYTSETFENAAFEIQTKKLADIQALGHDWEEPTYAWTEDNSKVTATRMCKNDAKHVEEETVKVHLSTKKATCEEPGEIDYTSAEFTNAAFEAQNKSAVDIPALGHDWADPIYTWQHEEGTVTASRVCKRDEAHTESETVDFKYTINISPTEEGEGAFTLISDEFMNDAFEVQQVESNIPALNQNTLWLPNGLTDIEEEAFVGITAQAVIIPDGCKSIGAKAFAGCDNLIYVYIPSSVETMAEDAFEGCPQVLIDQQK